MRIVITGAAGFVGQRLAHELSARLQLGGSPLQELILVDRFKPDIESNLPVSCRTVVCDLTDRQARSEIFRSGIDGVFHLAATMTADAERDFDQGLKVNVGAFMDFLDDCRAHGVPRLVFSSSMAAFGGPLPDVVPDEIPQRPQSSYGVQKVIAELLLDDYTRRGFLDARALRLPVVLLRPPGGAPTISGAISAVVCNPLEGRRVVCGFPPDAPMPVASVGAVAHALIRVFELPDEALGAVRTINLPALTVTMNQMIAALERRIGPAARELIEWQLDPQLTHIMGGMPKGMKSARAAAAGITSEPDFDSIIADYAARYDPRSRP
jgi:nucleoside-diphosphate-sugar epimerase